jgi:ABC-type transport system involved in multi-copper enzyme maturation permease subunit
VKPAFALLRVTVRQALPWRRTLLFVLLETAPGLIYLFATANRTEEFAYRSAVEIGASTYFALVLPVVSIVIAAGVLGNERRDLTLSFIALRPIPRPMIASAKLLAAIVAAFTINVVGALVLGLAHLVRHGFGGLLVALIAGALVATIAYCSVLVPLGFLTDRAVIIGIAYLLIFENGVAFLLTGLAVLSPWRIGLSVFADIALDARMILDRATAALSLGSALLAVFMYVVLSIIATSWLLRHRDLA